MGTVYPHGPSVCARLSFARYAVLCLQLELYAPRATISSMGFSLISAYSSHAAAFFMSNDRQEAALPLLKQVAALRPCCVFATCQLGVALFEAAQHEHAIKAFDDALSVAEPSASGVCGSCALELTSCWLGIFPATGQPAPVAFSRLDIMVWAARCLLALEDLKNAVSIVNQVISVSSHPHVAHSACDCL